MAKKKTTQPKETLIARLVVHGLDGMTARQRRSLANWLLMQTHSIEQGGNFSRRFTARYFR